MGIVGISSSRIRSRSMKYTHGIGMAATIICVKKTCRKVRGVGVLADIAEKSGNVIIINISFGQGCDRLGHKVAYTQIAYSQCAFHVSGTLTLLFCAEG